MGNRYPLMTLIDECISRWFGSGPVSFAWILSASTRFSMTLLTSRTISPRNFLRNTQSSSETTCHPWWGLSSIHVRGNVGAIWITLCECIFLRNWHCSRCTFHKRLWRAAYVGGDHEKFFIWLRKGKSPPPSPTLALGLHLPAKDVANICVIIRTCQVIRPTILNTLQILR